MLKSSNGKTSDGTTIAGCLRVRTTERRASSTTFLTRRLGLALERAAGLRQKHVVERRRVQLELVDVDVLGIERAHDLGELGVAAVEADGCALR
jgi:hypothetical protein